MNTTTTTTAKVVQNFTVRYVFRQGKRTYSGQTVCSDSAHIV